MTQKRWPEGWRDVTPGCMVLEAGSAVEYHTGSWRAKKPIWDNSKCIKCGVCYMFCPEGCINEDQEGFFVANLEYCKGCGICTHECWPKAIVMVNEED